MPTKAEKLLNGAHVSYRDEQFANWVGCVKQLASRYGELNGKDSQPFASFRALVQCPFRTGLGFEGEDGLRRFYQVWDGLTKEAKDITWIREQVDGELADVGGQAGNTNAVNAESRVENEVDNVNFVSNKGGNSVSYTVRRLHRDHPELHAKVEAGEMSANAAAIEAGFRKKPTPFDIVKTNWPKLTKLQRKEIMGL